MSSNNGCCCIHTLGMMLGANGASMCMLRGGMASSTTAARLEPHHPSSTDQYYWHYSYSISGTLLDESMMLSQQTYGLLGIHLLDRMNSIWYGGMIS